MKIQPPFSTSRFELEGKHLFYIHPSTLNTLENDKPIYLEGARGTGKTTLLQALNWKEQLKNKSLLSALDKLDSRRDYIGVYLKLPELRFNSLRRWESNEEYPLLVALYIETSWLEELLNSTLELITEGTFECSPKNEREITSKILSKHKFFDSVKTKLRTYIDLADFFKEIRINIENACLYNENTKSIVSSLECLPNFGELSSIVSTNVLSSNNYRVKVCLDECETLSSAQTMVLNTLVRLCKYPVYYIFSYVRLPDDTSTTYLPNLSVVKADADNISLDSFEIGNFKEFADGVAQVRLRKYYNDDNLIFSSDALLGKLSINALLSSQLAKSESTKSKALIDKSKEYANFPYFSEYIEEKHPPIYQTYLVESLDIDITKPKSKKEIRKDKSQNIRKKMVASYLSICHEYRMKPLYCSSEMLFHLCDKSIREYIMLMNDLFNSIENPNKSINSTQIPIATQNTIFKTFSKKKFESIRSGAASAVGAIKLLVYGFSKITSAIQSSSADNAHLKSIERGQFVLTKKTISSKVEDIMLAINEAAEAGFIKVLKNNNEKVTFRIHTSLAPYYEFSYRGAFYEVAILESEMSKLVESESISDVDKVIDMIVKRINKIGNKTEDKKQLSMWD